MDGDINARDAVIGGKVTGTVMVAGKTRLERSSVLNGDLRTMKLVVEEGAVFNGRSDMGGPATAETYTPRPIKLSDEE